MQFRLGWFANPLFGNGDYPLVMRERIQEKSMTTGLTYSRLPEFTDEEKMNNIGRKTTVEKIKAFVFAVPYTAQF